MCILELSVAIYVMNVQVDESVINEDLLNRPMHFIICIDTSLDVISIVEPTTGIICIC